MSWRRRGPAISRHLSRRTLLKGVLASGVGVSVGLPLLESMVDSNGEVLADGSPLPCRFGVYYWGNGIDHNTWVPSQTGFSWELPGALMPFAERSPELQQYLTLMTGFNHAHVNPGHIPAHGVALSASHNVQYVEADVGAGYRNRDYPSPTLDVLARDAWIGQTNRESLHVAITRADPYFGDISWEPGGRAINQPFSSPEELYDELFAGQTNEGPESARLSNLTRQLEGSMLDAIQSDASRLKADLPCSDRERLERHFEGLRAIERRIQNLEPLPETCTAGEPQVIDSTMLERSRVTAELLATAVACDITRVFTYEWSSHQSEFRYEELGIDLTHHNDISHSLNSRLTEFRAIMRLVMGGLAHFSDLLRQTPELDGNVLDNTLIFATSEHANGNSHDYRDHPLLFVGRAGGNIAAGQHFRHNNPGGNEDAPRVMLTALRAVGVDVPEIGMPAQNDSRGQSLPSRQVSETISDVEA